MFTWAYFSRVFMGVDTVVSNSERVRGGFYRGCRLLTPLAEFLHVPLDQINFVVCGLTAIILGHSVMRKQFSPAKVSPRVRAFVETVFGLILVSFCFGNQVRVLLLQSTVAYLLMYFLPHSQFTAVLVTTWSMFYMTLVHLCRLQYDYGGYTLDISGPVMVQTQRLSSLAFNLVDGTRIRERERRESIKHISLNGKPSSPKQLSPPPNGCVMQNYNSPQAPVSAIKTILMRGLKSFADGSTRRISEQTVNGVTLSAYFDRLLVRTKANTIPVPVDTLARMPPSHIEHAIELLPSPVEFFAYTLNFHTVSVGPFVFFNEYQTYLEGYEKRQLPDVDWAYALKTAIRTICAGLLTAYMCPYFPFDFVRTEIFATWSLLHRVFYCTISLFLVRQKYYFAWSLSEIGCICAGLGFTGHCPINGRPQYQRVCNFDLRHIECGLSLKNVVDTWNISTTRWLREVFYDRLPLSCRTLMVFVISALWHGFYPGYYLMFLTFALFTFVSRMWHRRMRTLCRQTPITARLYDLFTAVLTNLAINYAQGPFHLLDLSASLAFWHLFSFIPHLLGFLLLFGHFIQPRLSRSVNVKRPLTQFGHGRTAGG